MGLEEASDSRELVAGLGDQPGHLMWRAAARVMLSLGEVLPPGQTPAVYAERLAQLALPRLGYVAARDEAWWLEVVPFFDVERSRAWIFWRRLLHTAHHRTQLTVYLRLLGKNLPSTYGPTADVTWEGADPTRTAEAAGRK